RYWSEIHETVARSDYADRIEFHTEGVTEVSLSGFYRRASALFLPSKHEGFCVPVVEAMHFGVPIFSSNDAALRDTVACYGVRLESATESAIAGAMRKLHGDRFLRQRLARLSKIGFR